MRPPPSVRVGLLVLLLALAVPSHALAQKGDAGAGKGVYERKCALCHGDKGDGHGPGAERFVPRPRDFTKGLFKIRSTASNTPSDQDLFDVVTDGMPGTSMPGWSMLSEQDRWNVIAYIKTFSPDRFKEEPKRLELPPEVGSSEESIKRGREMFEAIECNKCHGNAGRADGPSRPELKDEWGFPIAPANLTKPWTFRGGKSRKDVATRLAGGVLGTPMPAFLDSVEKPEDIWHLANYVVSLGPEEPRTVSLITVSAVSEDIPMDPDAPLWKTQRGQDIVLAGQVVIEPRNFNPAIDMVTLRAVYNEREIAFHLTWDDPTESKPEPAAKRFADVISLQFRPGAAPGDQRPYFLMGDANDPVYLLRWEQGKGAAEVTANGPDTLKPLADSELTAQAVYVDGQYRLVLKRALAAKDTARSSFAPKVFTPIAFQAWDGGAGETGARMSLTAWYALTLEEPRSNRRFVVPPLVAVLTFAAMVLIIRSASRRYAP
jgi:DMSO reductase family type II enzyme heme b subunit